MKRFFTLFTTVMALFAVTQRAMADNGHFIYMLTAENVNGTTGNYDMSNNGANLTEAHGFTQKSGSTTVYQYTIDPSNSASTIYFRLGVPSWGGNNQMQPITNGQELTVNGDAYEIYYKSDDETCYYGGEWGKDKAWKLSYDADAYESITINFDLGNGGVIKRRVWVEGVKKTQTVTLTYLVGKFVRTYSSATAMDVVGTDLKVYEAYKYTKPEGEADKYAKGTLQMRQLSYIPANMGVVLVATADGTYANGDQKDFSLCKRTAESATDADGYKAAWTKADDYTADEWNNFLAATVTAVADLGNTEEADGNITYRFYGLSNYHSTAYYKANGEGDDYLGFFRLTDKGRSGANKAYLRMPASAEVEGGAFGYIDYNGQFIGSEDEADSAFGKMQLAFDGELGETTGISAVKSAATADSAYYTLQGMKVGHPTKGIYIHGGKKVVVK